MYHTLLFPLRGLRYLYTTSTYEFAVFNNIEAAVDEAFDIVCNGGLDIGDLVVEQNVTDDEVEITASAKPPPVCMLTTAVARTRTIPWCNT